MQLLNNNKLIIAGLGVGSLAGFIYYSTIGCESGGCAITSDPVNSTLYGAFMGALLFSSFKKKPKKKNNMDFTQMIKDGATVIDVRTRPEFAGGHVAESLNIPLQELNKHMDEIKAQKQPLILCCRTGNRSGIATQMLSQMGIECYNGGAWEEVNYHQAQAQAAEAEK